MGCGCKRSSKKVVLLYTKSQKLLLDSSWYVLCVIERPKRPNPAHVQPVKCTSIIMLRTITKVTSVAAAAAGSAFALSQALDGEIKMPRCLALDTALCEGGDSSAHTLGRWIDAWAKGRTGFHKSVVNPTLEK